MITNASPSSRPASSTSLRPPSGASQRSSSNLSLRPLSATSTRPQSRLSQRTTGRHARSRLIPFCQTLVTQITGLNPDGIDGEDENFRTSVNFAVKNLEATTLNKGAAGEDMNTIDRQIRGHADKARIHLQDTFAVALETSYRRLKDTIASHHDLDEEIKMSHLPDHLQLLISLSQPPSAATLAFAETYLDLLVNHSPSPAKLTWKDILAEEPFEGQHWEGVYGLPPGSVVDHVENQQASSDSSSTTPSLSSLQSDDSEIDVDESTDDKHGEGPSTTVPLTPAEIRRSDYTHTHREILENLRAKQYWRPEWKSSIDASFRGFDLGRPSLLGIIQHILAREGPAFEPIAATIAKRERHINEVDAVREILIALQGRTNLMLVWVNDMFVPHHGCPRILHLSLDAQYSILSSLACVASNVQHLRIFTSFVFSQSQVASSYRRQTLSGAHARKTRITRTLEAFADAIHKEIGVFDMWCTDWEGTICRARAGVADTEMVVSLLSIEKAVRDKFEGTFMTLLDIVNKVIPCRQLRPGVGVEGEADKNTWALPTAHPAAVTALLLDGLFEGIQQHIERGNPQTVESLMRVFTRSVEPVWAMIGRWLKDGMFLGSPADQAVSRLDDEFFIEGSIPGTGIIGTEMGLLNPDFWTNGYVLRKAMSNGEGAENETKMIPSFLKHVVDPVLASGKATGLLRSLGVSWGAGTQLESGGWRSFSDLLASEVQEKSGLAPGQLVHGSGGHISINTLVHDEVHQHCQSTASLLTKVLVGDCDLWVHISAIEGLYLMRQGDAISHFNDVLFQKMDNLQLWADFHFLNTAFGDVVENDKGHDEPWIHASRVRFSYHGNKDRDRSIHRTVKALDGLSVEYAVPFPLTYLFPPKILQCYSGIFTFLLQIRRAKNVLEKILIRKEAMIGRLQNELKILFVMRSRLSWFVNTLLNFLTTYVIHTQSQKFHTALRTAASLDEMILLHNDHLEKLQGRCLLRANTSALYRAILAILDTCLLFSNGFIAFAGDASTHDISRRSFSTSRRHRSKRLRRQRRNVIGFTQSLKESLESSDSESDSDEENIPMPSEHSMATPCPGEDDFVSRVDKMSIELDGLVRFVRRGVESLAGSTTEAASTFGVLAFALEDWDL